MTAVLQTYARKTKIPIDTLLFKTEVRKIKANEVAESPENGKHRTNVQRFSIYFSIRCEHSWSLP